MLSGNCLIFFMRIRRFREHRILAGQTSWIFVSHLRQSLSFGSRPHSMTTLRLRRCQPRRWWMSSTGNARMEQYVRLLRTAWSSSIDMGFTWRWGIRKWGGLRHRLMKAAAWHMSVSRLKSTGSTTMPCRQRIMSFLSVRLCVRFSVFTALRSISRRSRWLGLPAMENIHIWVLQQWRVMASGTAFLRQMISTKTIWMGSVTAHSWGS